VPDVDNEDEDEDEHGVPPGGFALERCRTLTRRRRAGTRHLYLRNTGPRFGVTAEALQDAGGAAVTPRLFLPHMCVW
jgi:hypothetical protein